MKAWHSVLACGLLLATTGCPSVNVPPEALFPCETSEDCGGGSWICLARAEQRSVCCEPSGLEVCNGRDDDCNGVADDLPEAEPCYSGPAGTGGIGACKAGRLTCNTSGGKVCTGQVLPSAELCNSVDDDCDGAVDEDFNLLSNPANCGLCGRTCNTDQSCINGTCQRRAEQSCFNGVDDDGDNLTDCADPDCDGQACGSGCTCSSGARAESACGDGQSNDGDNLTDCADPDCTGLSCGTGCRCGPAGNRVEISCSNDVDDDGDNLTDCADPDCNDQSCGFGCRCRSNTRSEVNVSGTEQGCCDGVDNDGDSIIDCAETSSCNNASCPGFICSNSSKVETACGDGQDNDGDTLTDCADSDCYEKSCGTGCNCRGGGKSERACYDLVDNDGDGVADCADSDCLGSAANASASVVCGPTSLEEANCNNGTDDDGDNKRDCGGNSEPNCTNGYCGWGCRYTATCGQRRETVCDDGINNDGDSGGTGGLDCNDSDCAGQPCRKADNTPGTCNGTSKQCM